MGCNTSTWNDAAVEFEDGPFLSVLVLTLKRSRELG